MFQARQGDVWIEGEPLPERATPLPRDAGRVILAYGEVTGHAHAILDPEVEFFTVADEVDRWLRVGGTGTVIQHEEHGLITLPPGDYRVRIQREYTPSGIRPASD